MSLAQSLGLSRQEHLMSLAGSSAAAQAAMSAAMSSQASMTLGGPPSSHPSQPKMEAMSNVGLFSIFRISFISPQSERSELGAFYFCPGVLSGYCCVCESGYCCVCVSGYCCAWERGYCN